MAADPPDDEAAEIARRAAAAMYADDLASRTAGITVDQVAPGSATASMTVADTMINGHEICHGGYVFLLADTAFAFACNTYGTPTVAQGCDIEFVRPARRGDRLVATASERGRYGRSGIYDVTVTCGDDVVAEFRGRSRTIPPRGPDRSAGPTAVPDSARPDRAVPNTAGPGDARPAGAGPGDAGPAGVGPGDAGPAGVGPDDAGPGDAGSAPLPAASTSEEEP